MAVKLSKSEQEVVSDFDLEFVEPPPEESITRKSKHSDRYEAAKQLCRKHPNEWLRMQLFNQTGQATSLAKAINNNERREFATGDSDEGHFEAYAQKIPAHINSEDVRVPDQYAVWLKYVAA